MILKKIILNNIRSYRNQSVEFPEGSTLLSGDIGSGKTSILLAVEFALFGLQPGQRGNALLRNGEKEGSVILEFNIQEKTVIVERTLKKNKSISQDYCTITVNGEKNEMSVTELKDRVLEILGYPKEFAKKQNLLYKFTVYTPQEEMKEIILEDPETRINTLRHVFGIDKYKKILENTSLLASKLREEKRLREGMIDSLEQDKVSLVAKEEELESKHYNLASVEKELFMKSESRKNAQEEKDMIWEKIEERRKLQQEAEKTKIMVSNKKESLESNKKQILEFEVHIKEFSEMKFDEQEIKKTQEKIILAKKEKDGLDEENLKLSAGINTLKSKNQENEILKARLGQIEICPTCLQNISSVYRSNVINKLEADNIENSKKIKNLDFEKEKILSEITKNEETISFFESNLQDLRIMKVRFQDFDEKKKRLSELEKLNSSVENDINILTQHMDSLNKDIFQSAKFVNIYEIKEKEFEEAMREERMAEIKVAELKKEIEVFSRQVEELKERIRRTEKIREKLDYITKLETWLSKNFMPLVSLIEKNVMIKLKSEFSELFARWFSMLVSDIFDVRLDDDFTPVIEHQDYELDYGYLSGGERTAVALAYRLALNQVINSIMSRIKTRDLVILDEPTDGFSEQQLDKMRDVLRQLEVKQLIIVSHEQKMESFVENIIRFRKERGVSGVASENFIK